MVEFDMMLSVGTMIEKLETPIVSEEEKYDLIDALDEFLENSNYDMAGVSSLSPIMIWGELYNNNIISIKSKVINYIASYSPIPSPVVSEVIYNLKYNKQVLNILISIKHNLVDALSNIMRGVPHGKAYSPKTLAEISESNVTPKVFTEYLIDVAINLRGMIEIAIDMDDDELEELLSKAETETVKYLMITHVNDISSSDWSRFQSLAVITFEDIERAIVSI